MKNAIYKFMGIHYDITSKEDKYDDIVSTSHSTFIHYGNDTEKIEKFKEFC